MYKSRVNAFNAPVDFEALDKLAKTNALAKEKLFVEMKKMLNKAASLIGGFKPNDLDVIAQQLFDDDFKLIEIKKGTDLLVSKFDKFPSYKELKMFLQQFKSKTHVTSATCLTCANSGLISRYLKETNVSYAFRCDCIYGNAYPRFQAWSSINQNLYCELRKQ